MSLSLNESDVYVLAFRRRLSRKSHHPLGGIFIPNELANEISWEETATWGPSNMRNYADLDVRPIGDVYRAALDS
ncbi:hypothetical protein BLJ79_18005 [Arthrobacter sp. UCD-GKA]|nr:hypothetical protein BLJ79_18005 [Arthrobacter sp. UCD-GKA]